ncbi:TPR repeat-containing protein YrrB [Roseovarius litorisediminis]|uniref:TPR repeat-containing protein YrrB n=1 Tax=Roseovarius litorisediminis TaxID=1312363 RepID=A0A1Y5S6Q1_9RHOB|nr:sulfotransferase [Roseovarius litorisediminis]SLN32464.1 TPR repeat-containing protein YrrB [Roseovarius litorisediminis]
MTESQAAAAEKEKVMTQEILERIARHQNAGRLPEALQLLEGLIEEKGEMPRLLHYKGLNLAMSGNIEEGERLIRDGLKAAPEDPMQHADLGVLLAQSNRLEEAIEHFRTAVEAAPNFGVAHSNLGGALVLQKKYGEAVKHLERAIELETGLLDAHTNLGIAYSQVNQHAKAVEVLYKALSIDPLSIRAHIQLSAALYRNERHDTAEHHARRAIELDPNAAEAYLHLGNALGSAGKMDEAAEALLAVSGRPPVGLPALSRLIHLRKTKEDSPELKILEKYLERLDNLGEEAQSTAHFAAGKAYDDLGKFPLAFEHFRKGNEISRTLHPFDKEAYVARAERLRAFASPELVQRCSGQGITDIAPIFITGMPRSGTTLMDQMFSRHPKVMAGGELRAMPAAMHRARRMRQALQEEIPDSDITADDFSRLGENYMDGVRSEGIKSEYVSDKMPSNYLYAGLIALAMPRAKILFMRRHPLDCLLSNYMQHFGQNQPFSTDFDNLALVYAEFDKMVNYWTKVIPDRVRVVNYEDVTTDSEAQMRSILDWVGLDWDPEVLNYKSSTRQVNTASLAQVREPIYTRSVARWKNYAPNLGGLAKPLAKYLSDEDLALCQA